LILSSRIPPPPRATLFPYTTLFRSVGNPAFFTALESTIKSVPLDQWKAYLRWHFLHDQADALPVAFGDENFNFYGKVLGGAKQRSEEHTSELQSRSDLVCRLLLEKK